MINLPIPLNILDAHEEAINLPPPQQQVPLPVPNSTRSFWFTSSDVHPTPTEGSEGSLPQDTDICIIGSGISGVSAAYHLAKGLNRDRTLGGDSSLKAVILEAREFCGSVYHMFLRC